MYHWNALYDIASTIELKENQTFDYNWKAGLTHGTSHGSWRLEGSEIILNSELQPGAKNYELVASGRSTSDSIMIQLIDLKNEPIQHGACIIKSEAAILIQSMTDSKGGIKLPKFNSSDSLLISVLGYETIRYQLDSSVTKYTFQLDYRVGSYEFFTDVKWRYKNGRLYDPGLNIYGDLKNNYYHKVN